MCVNVHKQYHTVDIHLQFVLSLNITFFGGGAAPVAYGSSWARPGIESEPELTLYQSCSNAGSF